MIAFEPSEDQQMIRESVAHFAKSTLAPRVREFERQRAVPEEVRRTAHEMGLGAMDLPESCGGQGLGLVTAMLVEEELGAADAGAAFGLAGPHAFGAAVRELGSEIQAKGELTPFSEPEGFARFGAVAWSEAAPNRERPGFTTVATRQGDGWKLTGKKAYVVNAALADRFVVFAQVDATKGWNGIGAFLVAKDNPGLGIGARYDTLGLDAASFGEVTLEGAVVADAAALTAPADAGDDAFTRATLRFFAKHALKVAARAVGVSRFGWEIAREHCETRKAFGKPIGHFQAVAFALSDRLMDLESARWLVWRAAAAWDGKVEEKQALLASAQAVAHALEASMRCADDCVSLHGGSGFIRDLVAEKLMRDAKQLALCCPTAEQMDQLATVIELGAPLDPALVLPTSDAQPIFT